jgi:hypothetical protein
MKNIFISLLALTILFSSCKKVEEAVDEIQKDKTMANDNHMAEDEADDISVVSDEAYNYGELRSRGGSGGSSFMGDTVKIIRSKTDSTITIDFGTNGIVGKNGKIRKGKIIIKFNGGYKVIGSAISQSFDNYFVNGRKIEGTRSITYKGDTSGMPKWTIQSDLTITKTDGKKVTWSSTRTRIMTAGSSTPLNWYDDEYTVSGSANGTTSNGDAYTMTIGKPLFFKMSFAPPTVCKFIIDGTLTYTRGSRTASLDYGYGGITSCDNQAELNYNGTKSIITL